MIARRFTSSVIETFCALALVVSCGLPQALHDLGHVVSRTQCEDATAQASAHAQISGPSLSVTETHDPCWLAGLLSSTFQNSVSLDDSIARDFNASPGEIHAWRSSNALISTLSETWHLARGPPKA